MRGGDLGDRIGGASGDLVEEGTQLVEIGVDVAGQCRLGQDDEACTSGRRLGDHLAGAHEVAVELEQFGIELDGGDLER